LIPDFIPVLGYVDDLILVPLGVMLVMRMVPKSVLAECREAASAATGRIMPKLWIASAVIIGMWVLILTVAIVVLLRTLGD
jgi:uncharacterized membrane protein YkvA (DUF1232 family)